MGGQVPQTVQRRAVLDDDGFKDDMVDTRMFVSSFTASDAAVPNEADILMLVHEVLEHGLPTDRPISVLEAGGGSNTKVNLNRTTRIVTVDNNPIQLERNQYAEEKRLADLEVAGSLRGKYDLVVCWNVLEHLRRPSVALANMAGCLAEDGFLLIGCPEPLSLKGLITKLTPHRVHVWYYRYIGGQADAGKYGYAPFVTVLHPDMSAGSIRQQSERLGLEIALSLSYRGYALEALKRKSLLGHAVYESLAFVWRLGTFFRTEPSRSDYVVLLRKRSQRSSNDTPCDAAGSLEELTFPH